MGTKKAKKIKSKFSDAELAELGRKYKEAQEQEKAWKEIKSEVGQQIIAELDARGTHVLENDGVKITDTVQKRTIYNYYGLVEVLPKKIMNAIRPQAIDSSALSRLVQAGVVNPETVAEHTELVEHARYPTISYTEG